MITFDYGRGEGGKKCQNIDYVICERPLTLVLALKWAGAALSSAVYFIELLYFLSLAPVSGLHTLATRVDLSSDCFQEALPAFRI